MACLFDKYFDLAFKNKTGEPLAFVVADIAFKVVVMIYSVVKISFFVVEITFKVPLITSSVAKITFVETEVTF